MKTLRYGFVMLALALFIAGCAKTVKPVTAPAAVTTPPVTAAPTTTTAAAPSQTTLSPLDDPNNILYQKTVYFDFDKSNIKPEFLDLLTAHAKYLMAHPEARVRIEGYTDERGTWEYNIALGDRRAQSVRRFLLFQGVNPNQLSTVSYGEAHAVCHEHDEACWHLNRRAVLVYLTQ
ncbi:MAG TPA: peptidoglycan-associated lipoprotein Pal [Gammaproteobacteria bacterium]|nr:peptidoglycan-associated lipoprotein Pal [Gammaproteobacteria bacterium]